MSKLDDRYFILAAVLLLCIAASVFLGLPAGVWSFVQMAVVIELLFWIGALRQDDTQQLNVK